MKTLIRITTVPLSLEKLLEGQLNFIKNHFDVIAVSSDKEKLKAFGEKQGVEFFYLELTRKITPIKDIKAVYNLYKFLKKEKPFIVHSHTPKAGIVGMLASFLAKCPHRLHTVAGMPLLETKGVKRIVLNFVEKLTYSLATKVYPNSFGMKEIIIKNKFTSQNKLKVIAKGSSNGINLRYFDPSLFSNKEKETLRIKLGINKDDFVFIFVGRIVGDKGINELLRVFDEISKEKTNVKLLLVGGLEEELDPLSRQTKNVIKENKHVISVGYQSDVRPYFSIANVLTFPSYREGFPNVVMQAGAMGMPSIVSDINGCNEIIKEGVNGMIIPTKNIDKLKEAMIKMTKYKIDPLLPREMIKKSFSQEFVWNELLMEYERLKDV